MDANPLADTPVLLLAGGLGTRLRPVLADRPKALAPVAGTPFLKIQIELLRDQGARRFVLCIGHLAEQIRGSFGDGSALGVSIEYSLEGERLLGTGGALKLAERFFAPRALVLNGDTFLGADYAGLVRAHLELWRSCGALATLALARAPDAARYGTCLLNPSGRFVTGFREKEEGIAGVAGWLNAGAYVLERDLLAHATCERPCSVEREVFPAALAAGGPVGAFACPGHFYDIGTPEGLQSFLRYYDTEIRHERRAVAG